MAAVTRECESEPEGFEDTLADSLSNLVCFNGIPRAILGTESKYAATRLFGMIPTPEVALDDVDAVLNEQCVAVASSHAFSDIG